MCGLAGFIDVKQRLAADERARIARAMGMAIEHRGPDDWGVHQEPEAGLVLSFRRLAIIDLSSTGQQPMISASGRSVIAYNGEIYNAAEIAKELEGVGHRFRGHSDTEVLLEAFDRWGVEETMPRLVGMFAIAFYRRESRRLTLIRDRLGKKPLYFGKVRGTVFFGSQPKSFFAHPSWSPEIDRKSVAAFMRWGYVPAPRSIYRGVESLRPAERIDIVAGDVVHRSQYWNIRHIAARAQRSPNRLSDVEVKARFEALLEEAVKVRMVSDVPLGAFLSGGIDSSTIAALMQKNASRPIKTFSIGFDEAEYDESKHAAAVARHLGTEHQELVVRPEDALNAIPLMPDYFDEPFADASQVPTYLLSKLARQDVTVALSGDGGDELLAGYPRYRIANETLANTRRIPKALRAVAAAMLQNTPNAVWQCLQPILPRRHGISPLAGRAKRLGRLMAAGAEERVFQNIVGQWPDPERLVRDTLYEEDSIWAGALADELPDPIRRFQMLDTLTYLPDDILVKVDRSSMGVALETRVPLLDHRVVEFTLGLPAELLERSGETKWLLRQVLYEHVPKALLDRPKTGFMMPIDQWLRGPLRDWAEDLLDEKHMAVDGILDPTPIRETWAQHLSGQINWQYRLWCVLMFQAWKRRWMEGIPYGAI
ncbi:asparagine synthase (glutamine-hydrolyzing) [Thiorhodovibrio frisius]|uniref:asparagine synthase (glutamine-hydrolyzing) n=1 Tax=Thiorhodovibrio frisius TaxID=631362 RepID=H8Z1R7_9GAMM|nr:asparagine synthase (glutamine-hydrolyzing) [Thiorhodovibrio frisius]EIC22545.1 asparagine synthase, glutamine-hydrolyzing [Thiorhodovibrio frisius]WPL19985.1 Asparagine synthetase [glutamine-hydrolyzing] 1 [Thiorhodovibrio frisius]